jgi:hypothetical protein
MAQLAIANDARKRIDGVVIDRSDLGLGDSYEIAGVGRSASDSPLNGG